MIISTKQIEQLNSEIESIICQYKDVSTKTLAQLFNVGTTAKNAIPVLTQKLIENSGSTMLRQLLLDADFRIKTIRLDKYGQLKESMSLPTFRYCDLINETWESSTLRSYFHQKAFAFSVYRASGKELYLNKIIIWQMPVHILESGVRKAWLQMHSLLEEGKIVKYIDDHGRYFTYFPSSTENPYVHVRPHAQNREDTYPLPVADKLTGLVQYPKHSFWLNRSFVLKIITRETL